jgi:uncharacterized protein
VSGVFRRRTRRQRQQNRIVGSDRPLLEPLAFRAGIGLTTEVKPQINEAEILALERPDKALWTFYLLRLLVVPPVFPILVLPMYFRYHTMRYKFTDEGISMKWGVLFRREIILNYARIQDIHLQSNIIERWLGLARILVQTASGNASAEMTIEGIKQFEAVRDFLYSRMRGVKDAAHRTAPAPPTSSAGAGSGAELATVLRDLTLEMRAIRQAIEKNKKAGKEAADHV